MATTATTTTTTTTANKRGFAMDFLIAGVATGAACVVSNPMEVVKTRMQLQGELAMTAVGNSGAAPTVRYRNFAHGFYTICRTEGLAGIQRGLLPGMGYQVRLHSHMCHVSCVQVRRLTRPHSSTTRRS